MALGAKQLVVDKTQAMESFPFSLIINSILSISVRNSSPTNTFSITIGSNPTQEQIKRTRT